MLRPNFKCSLFNAFSYAIRLLSLNVKASRNLLTHCLHVWIFTLFHHNYCRSVRKEFSLRISLLTPISFFLVTFNFLTLSHFSNCDRYTVNISWKVLLFGCTPSFHLFTLIFMWFRHNFISKVEFKYVLHLPTILHTWPCVQANIEWTSLIY